MPYYKYTKQEFIKPMLTEGKIRIGTLHEYRGFENKEIGDQNEGKGNANTFIINQTFNGGDKLPGGFNQMYRISEDSEDINIVNCGVSLKVDLPDTWIFCLTKKVSSDIMTKFGYNAVVEITDVQNFADEINKELFKQELTGSYVTLASDCRYSMREIGYQTERDIIKLCWYKEEVFRHQEEYRIVFCPNEAKRVQVKPLLINIPGIIPYLRQVDSL